jgi:hypothetical protein
MKQELKRALPGVQLAVMARRKRLGCGKILRTAL